MLRWRYFAETSRSRLEASRRWIARRCASSSEQQLAVLWNAIDRSRRMLHEQAFHLGVCYHCLSGKKWCPGAESNHRHEDFQS